MGVEYEIKYRATPEQLALLRERVGADEKEFSMRTTYYDTPDGALSAKQYTLRKRMENGTAVCTAKTPLPGKGRGEWETPCDTIEEAIPVLCKLGAPEDLLTATARGVIPICGAAFTRLARIVETPDFTAELALDQGYLFSGEKRMPLCEAELELKSGSGQAMEAYGRGLAAVLGLTAETKSKFRRGLALYRGENHG